MLIESMSKVNFIRVINCLYELSFFTDKNENDTTKKEVFEMFGKAINLKMIYFKHCRHCLTAQNTLKLCSNFKSTKALQTSRLQDFSMRDYSPDKDTVVIQKKTEQ